MTTTATNISHTTRRGPGLRATIRSFYDAIIAAFECRDRIYELSRKSDADLARMGIARGDIPMVAYRAAFGA
ncbi:hypothetical protein MLD63_03200 (plasmid) [Paracoccus sp. TK19116]|uniref:DUF1127 domain-containing protein n=1 Tax=Paracoccus albicereus TaxID=2922394 RepID=A0ABT1MMD3_9RHOB|nr:hypothetical protein [Paracoccus albicereus]MCQ0969445.1 hypothetical protein [Paracoccus albicereus]